MARSIPYHDYSAVPWYRTSAFNSVFLFLQLPMLPFVPVSLGVCIVLLTGDVYYDKKDAKGDLKRWGFGNKIAAVLVLVACIAFLICQPLRPAL